MELSLIDWSEFFLASMKLKLASSSVASRFVICQLRLAGGLEPDERQLNLTRSFSSNSEADLFPLNDIMSTFNGFTVLSLLYSDNIDGKVVCD